MKKNKILTLGLSAAVLFSMGIAANAHAWGFKFSNDMKKIYNNQRTQTQKAGRDSNSNSHNTTSSRYNSHNINGGANNSVVGNNTVTIGNNFSDSRNYQQGSGLPSISYGAVSGSQNNINHSISGNAGVGDQRSYSNNYGTVTTNNNDSNNVTK